MLGKGHRDRNSRRSHILVRFGRSDWSRVFERVRLGIPTGLTIVAESGLFSAAALIMGLISTEALAAHAIALQCVAVVFMVPLGIGQAAVVRVGLAAGARDGEGVRRAGWSALLASTLFMACSALAFWFAGRFLVGLFLDPAMPENAPVIDLAAP